MFCRLTLLFGDQRRPIKCRLWAEFEFELCAGSGAAESAPKQLAAPLAACRSIRLANASVSAPESFGSREFQLESFKSRTKTGARVLSRPSLGSRLSVSRKPAYKAKGFREPSERYTGGQVQYRWLRPAKREAAKWLASLRRAALLRNRRGHCAVGSARLAFARPAKANSTVEAYNYEIRRSLVWPDLI